MTVKIKLLSLAAISVFTFLLCSCQTTKVELSDYSPMLIKTSYSNRGLSWYTTEEVSSSYKTQPEDDGLVTGLINRTLDKDNPEFELMQERIDEATAIFVKTLRENNVTVIDPKVKPEAAVYTKFHADFFDSLSNVVAADGYKPIGTVSSRNDVIDAKDTGAKSLCYLKFKFQRAEAVTGFHKDGVSARVVMNVYVSDENGKKLLYKDYAVQAVDYAPYDSWGRWNKEFVCKQFADLVQILCNRFIMDYINGESESEAGVENIENPDSSLILKKENVSVSENDSVSEIIDNEIQKNEENSSQKENKNVISTETSEENGEEVVVFTRKNKEKSE